MNRKEGTDCSVRRTKVAKIKMSKNLEKPNNLQTFCTTQKQVPSKAKVNHPEWFEQDPDYHRCHDREPIILQSRKHLNQKEHYHSWDLHCLPRLTIRFHQANRWHQGTGFGPIRSRGGNGHGPLWRCRLIQIILPTPQCYRNRQEWTPVTCYICKLGTNPHICHVSITHGTLWSNGTKINVRLWR
jgi:hypothetical protein